MLENELLIESRFSAWQNKKVRTIVVNSRAKIASQRSISNAISHANPYDRIELVGGEYFETLSIPFPMELVASEGEDAKVTFRGTCLTIAMNCPSFIANIEFSSKGKQRNEPAVLVTAGTPEFSRCTMTNIAITGKGFASLLRCVIKESMNGVGLRVADQGGGKVEGCTIHSHNAVCVEVDTLGELTIYQCTIYQPVSTLTVVVVQSVISNASRYDSGLGRGEESRGLYCKQVKFVENRIFAQEGVPFDPNSGGSAANTQNIIPVMSTFGAPSCVLISHEAQPLFEGNEMTEGNVGMIFERLGSAQLKRNIFRSQRRCGIFFLLPEADLLVTADMHRQSIKITDHNFFDRCRIGIDVQCGATGALAIFHSDSEVPLRMNTTVPRTGPIAPHSWTVGLPAHEEDFLKQEEEEKKLRRNPQVALATALDLADVSLPDGTRTHIKPLSEYLLSIIEDVFLAHPHILTKVKQNADKTPAGYLATTHSVSPFGFLSVLLDDPAQYRPARRRLQNAKQNNRVANESLEALRGGFGIHVVHTKFFNCALCGIRFGNSGRGLVDSCDFDRCGAAAILSESGSYPMIVGSTFQNNAECSVQVSNDADPLIVCNEFESSASSGIQIAHYSRGLLLGNIIAGSQGVGITLDDSSSTIIAHNFITRNREGGIRICNGSKPLLVANQVTGNFAQQIEVASYSSPVLVKNQIVSGGTVGILFTECGGGLLFDNVVSFQSADGIVIELDADPVIEHNKVSQNKGNGLLIRNNGSGTIVENIIEANETYNIKITEGGSSVIRANTITGGLLGGVCVTDEGTAWIEKNSIVKNGLVNVSIKDEHSDPVIVRNRIGECHSGVGILCTDGCSGKVLKNSFFGNKNCALRIEKGAAPLVQGNSIFNELCGVLVTNSGLGEITDNDIYDLRGMGIALQERCCPKIVKNRISSCGLCGIMVAPDGFGTVLENSIRHCGVGIIAGSTAGVAQTIGGQEAVEAEIASKAGVKKVTPDAARQQPVAAFCSVERNDVGENDDCGVLLESGASCAFSGNNIVRNGRYGVLGDVRYRAEKFAKLAERRRKQQQDAKRRASGEGGASDDLLMFDAAGTFASSVSAAVGGGTSLLESNTISFHTVANVAMLNHTDNQFVFRKNRIFNAPCGVLVRDGSRLHSLKSNSIQYSADGVSFEFGGRGTVCDNDITYCSAVGLYIVAGADPVVEGNRISMCGVAGVFADAGGRGDLKRNAVKNCHVGVVLYTALGDAALAPMTTATDASLDPSFGFLQLRQQQNASGQGSSSNSGMQSGLSATTSLDGNDVSEHELHGVLILTVAHPLPLRSMRVLPSAPTTEPGDAPKATQLSIQAYQQLRKDGERLFPLLKSNKIHRNRFCGVFHEKFQFLDIHSADNNSDDDGDEFEDIRPVVASNVAGSAQTTPRKTGKRHTNVASAQSPVHHNKRRQSTAAPVAGGGSSTGGPSVEYDPEPYINTQIVSHASLVDNEIYENSIGVGVGQEVDLFALRCRIHHNSFFGILLRATARPAFLQCAVSDNGLAGLYACRFALGIFSQGDIFQNNLLCRQNELANESRSISTFVVSTHFLPQITLSEWMEAGLLSDSVEGKAFMATFAYRVHRGIRQLSTLCEVHTLVLEGACQVLSDVIAAPSNVLSIASAIIPNPFFSRASGGDSKPSPATDTTPHGMSEAMSAMEQSNSAPVSDGGIGIWLEEGAQVEIVGSVIREHKHCGILFSRGLLSHHHVMRMSYERSQQDLSLVREQFGWKTRRFAPSNPGVLFSQQNLVHSTTAQNASDNLFDRTATYLDATASTFTGSPNRNHNLSAQGNSPGGILPSNSSALQGPGLNSNSNHHGGAPILKGNKIIHNERDGVRIQLFHNMVAQQCTSANKENGAGNPTTGSKSLAEGGKSSSSSNLKRSNSQRRKSSVAGKNEGSQPSTPTNAGTSSSGVTFAASPSRRSVPLPHLFDADVAAMQFSLILEDNEISFNQWRGVLCEHIAEINASSVFSSRVALNERFEEQAVHVPSEMDDVLRASSTTRAVRQLQLQRLVVEAGRLTSVRHAKLRLNVFHSNVHNQAECTTKFVVYSGDRQRTLLHMDTSFDKVKRRSMFSFMNLMRVPLVADLTLCPPPGVFLFDENIFHSGNVGIRLCGIVATQSVRVRANHFSGLSTAGLLVDGPRAAVAVGDGNCFEENRVGILFSKSTGDGRAIPTDASPTSAVVSVDDLSPSLLGASRVFKNKFRANTVASILVETPSTLEATAMLPSGAAPSTSTTFASSVTSLSSLLLLPPPVIFRNDFSDHTEAAAAMIVCGHGAAAWITGNTFHHNVSALIVSGGCALGRKPSQADASDAGAPPTSALRRVVLVELNKFKHNVIGVHTLGGGTSTLTSNYFRGNRWAGVCLTGLNTYSFLKSNVFEAHTPALSSSAPAFSIEVVPSPTKRKVFLSSTVVKIGDAKFFVSMRLPSPSFDAGAAEPNPCGMMIDAAAGCFVEQCLFMNNEIGVDLIRDVFPQQAGYLNELRADEAKVSLSGGSKTQAVPSPPECCNVDFKGCVFRGNSVSGIHVRGSPSRQLDALDSKHIRSLVTDAAAFRKDFFAAVVTQCLFEDNGAIRGGDVVASDFGQCAFHENYFLSVIRCLNYGYCVFERNVIAGTKCDVGIVFEAGCRSCVQENIFKERRVGIRAETNSFGFAERNLLTNGTIGIEAETFTSTMVAHNTIALMEDCGVLAQGGVIRCNTIHVCPVGVVVRQGESTSNKQHQDTLQQHTRFMELGGNYELQLVDNTIHTCDTDGILIGGGGRFEGNHVSNCKTNVSVTFVPPAGTNPSLLTSSTQDSKSSSVPRFSNNFVFDGQYGVMLLPYSVCIVSNNDVFDNSMSGIVCQPNSNCIVESNHVSSTMDHGALEIAPDSKSQVHHNTVRNQFSPAYNKGLAGHRAKERTKDAGAFAALLAHSDEKLCAKQSEARALSQTLSQLYQKLADDPGRTNVISDICAAGSKSTGQQPKPRALSFDAFEEVTAGLKHLRSSSNVGAAKTPQENSLEGDADTRRSQSAFGRVKSLQQLRSKDSSKSSASAANVVKESKKSTSSHQALAESEAQRNTSGGGGRSRASVGANLPGQPLRVLIHFFSLPAGCSAAPSSAAVTPREQGDDCASVMSRLSNAVAGSFHAHRPGTSYSTMVTSDPSAIGPLIKSQAPNAVVLVVLPAVFSDKMSIASPSSQISSVISQADETTLPRLQRLLQTLPAHSKDAVDGDGKPLGSRAALLIPQDALQRLEGNVKKPQGKVSAPHPPPPSASSPSTASSTLSLSFDKFVAANCDLFPFDSMDDLEERVLEILHSEHFAAFWQPKKEGKQRIPLPPPPPLLLDTDEVKSVAIVPAGKARRGSLKGLPRTRSNSGSDPALLERPRSVSPVVSLKQEVKTKQARDF